MAERRRTFGPVVLVGLASAGLAAVAGNRDWAVVDEGPSLVADTDAGKMPLAGALALVVLAAWGVLLVTRGVVRRVVAVLALLASLGVLAVAVAGFADAPDNLTSAVSQLAYGEDVGVHRTAWYWVAVVASVVSVAATCAAVALVGSWPEMGGRYDAAGASPKRLDTDLDLWKAMDEGHDPTMTDRRPPDP